MPMGPISSLILNLYKDIEFEVVKLIYKVFKEILFNSFLFDGYIPSLGYMYSMLRPIHEIAHFVK